jgi:hypothetical protein
VPHELNFREHPELQRAALQALYREVGFARSLLAYELPDGRLKLLDGHLRRELSPDLEVDVEVLDISEGEARALLLSIDPLAALAETQVSSSRSGQVPCKGWRRRPGRYRTAQISLGSSRHARSGSP